MPANKDFLMSSFVDIFEIHKIAFSQIVRHRMCCGQHCLTFIPESGMPHQMSHRVGKPTTVLTSMLLVDGKPVEV